MNQGVGVDEVNEARDPSQGGPAQGGPAQGEARAGEEREVPLRQLLIAVGDPLVEVLAAPRGFDVPVADVAILDPEEDISGHRGDFVLVIGARGRAALRVVRAAARAGAVAVAVKVTSDQDARVLRDSAIDEGIALLGVRGEVRWEQLESFARSALHHARLAGDAEAAESIGDLFSLAQTVAAITGGSVSIEDTANRVLAYSRSDEDVDELRRLSILGRQGPESYLVMLREWGVYERLRSGEEVVRIDEHPDLGIRGRMAVGIHAGAQPLGTIWVQEGRRGLAPDSERALLGAARVAALHLIRQRTEASAGPRFRENLLTGLLDGRVDARSVADNIGADVERPAAVAVFTLRPAETLASDHAERELQRAELTSLISVHAAAYRRSALVTMLGSRVYVLLPDLPGRGAGTSALGLVQEIAQAARQHLRVRIRAGVGSAVGTLEDAAESRAEADRVLGALSTEGGPEIATLDDVRAHVLLGEALSVLRGQERFRDGRLDALRAHDAEHGAELARSLLAYLDAFGDVRSASAQLHVHPNTLRYRIRRAGEIAGVDLGDATERLSAQLQLRAFGTG
ncbi:helix-turn-helix domain-containing protein [Salinifilum aidingensis]